jgi:hypothetical protein
VLRAVVCGRCWAAHGGTASAQEIGPEPTETVTSVDPAGQGQWLRALRRQSWVQAARVDARRNVLAVARLVALYAQWDTLESRPTWARLIARSGLAERTVARWLQELRVRGWLAHLEHGSTPTTRPMALAHLDGNRAALYGLRIPLTPEEALARAGDRLVEALVGMLDAPSEGDRPPALAEGQDPRTGTGSDQPEQPKPGDKNGSLPLVVRSSSSSLICGFSRASTPVDNFPTPPSRPGTATKTALRAGSEEEIALDLSIMVPVSGYQMLACADWLRTQLPVFARCSRKLVRHLCKPYWRAGWCGRDIVHAMDHRPSVFSQPARVLVSPTHVVSPAQFIRARLAAWRSPDGTITTGYWAAKVADAAEGKSARAQVAARYGRAGASLLRAGERALSADHIAEHGRAVRAQMRAHAAATHSRSSTPPRSAPGSEADVLRAQLVAEARAELARHSARSDAGNIPRTGTGTAPPPPKPPAVAGSNPAHAQATDGDVYDRALARARAERGRGTRRRTPRTWG